MRRAREARTGAIMKPVKILKLYCAFILLILEVNCQLTTSEPDLTEIKRRSFDNFPTTEKTVNSNVTEVENDPFPEITVADLSATFQNIIASEGGNKVISDRIIDILTKNNISSSEFAKSKLVSELYHLEVGASKIKNYICKQQIVSAINGARTGQVWTLKMYDSSAKVPGGLLHGSHYQLGNYDECMSHPLRPGHAAAGIAPQYCIADVTLTASKEVAKLSGLFQNGNVTLHWAVCIPSSCSPLDTIQFMEGVLNSTGFIIPGVNISFDVGDHMCQQTYKLEVDGLDIFFVSAVGIFVLIISISTIYNFIQICKKEDSKIKRTLTGQILMSFSLIENIRKLGSKCSSDLGLESLNGIKALAMIFIVGGHALQFLVTGPVLNADFFQKEKSKIQNAFLLNSPLLVDTFLLLSGFLMCRILLLELEKHKGKINFLTVYIFRYTRLTPAYLVIVMLYSTWLVDLNDGPLWTKVMNQEKDRCRSSWWANILYINNYVNTDKLCMFQSWYLSTDTQLFFLAPLVVYPLWRWRRFGEVLLAAATMISVAIPIAITYISNLAPTLLITSTKSSDLAIHEYFITSYIKTHMRASSYCMGLLCGYILHRIQLNSSESRTEAASTTIRQRHFSTWTVRCGWAVGILAGVGSMFSVTAFYKPDAQPGPMISALYAGLHRFAWCVGTGWLIIACATGHGGFLNKLLSWRALVPLARLTYCAYLMNGLIELYALATVRNGRYMSVYTLLSDCLSHICLTFLGALILCVMFESPMHGLQKILIDKYTKAPRKTQETNNEA